jgi:hypothetical protein
MENHHPKPTHNTTSLDHPTLLYNLWFFFAKVFIPKISKMAGVKNYWSV